MIVIGYFSTLLCCSYLTVSMKESRKHFSCCHSSTPLVLIDSLSLNTCCFNYWLCVVAITTALTSTLLILGGLVVVVALKLTCWILNMFCTSILGAFSGTMFYAKTNYTWITNMYFYLFNRLSFCPYYKFCKLNCNSWHNW